MRMLQHQGQLLSMRPHQSSPLLIQRGRLQRVVLMPLVRVQPSTASA